MPDISIRSFPEAMLYNMVVTSHVWLFKLIKKLIKKFHFLVALVTLQVSFVASDYYIGQNTYKTFILL